MARCLWVVVAMAVLLPLSSAQTLVGNATQVTDLCDAQFCLAGSPAACGGLCFLTAASDDTSFCTAACQASWYNPRVALCLSNQAVGTYVNEKISDLYTMCNAGKIAAAKLAAATAKFNALFPCTSTLTSAQFDPLGMATCPTTATAICPATCSSALALLPKACKATVDADATWAAAVKACTTATLTPATLTPTPSGLTPTGLEILGLSPTAAPADTGSGASIQAAIASPLVVVLLVSGLLHVLA